MAKDKKGNKIILAVGEVACIKNGVIMKTTEEKFANKWKGLGYRLMKAAELELRNKKEDQRLGKIADIKSGVKSKALSEAVKSLMDENKLDELKELASEYEIAFPKDVKKEELAKLIAEVELDME